MKTSQLLRKNIDIRISYNVINGLPHYGTFIIQDDQISVDNIKCVCVLRIKQK